MHLEAFIIVILLGCTIGAPIEKDGNGEAQTSALLMVDELKSMLADQQKVIAEQEKRLDDVVHELGPLRKAKKIQDDRISVLKNAITLIEFSIANDANVLPVERQLSDLTDGSIDEEQDQQNNKNTDDATMLTTIRRIQRQGNAMESKLNLLGERIDVLGSVGVVMFQASRNEIFTGSDTQNTVIPFDDVRINIGGGYDGSTGVFTAPASGYYMIGHRFMADGSCGSTEVQTRLYVNSGSQNSLQSTHHNGASMSGLVYLNIGDTAWIVVDSSFCLTISDYTFNNFFGYLVYESI